MLILNHSIGDPYYHFTIAVATLVTIMYYFPTVDSTMLIARWVRAGAVGADDWWIIVYGILFL